MQSTNVDIQERRIQWNHGAMLQWFDELSKIVNVTISVPLRNVITR